MTWADVAEGLKLNIHGLEAALAIAATCSYIGVYVVLKRIVFVGASLSQISSAGVALAFLLGASFPLLQRQPLAVSLAVTLVGVFIYSQQTLSRRIPREAIIGIGYLVASALTLIFIVRSPKGLEEVKELLDGNVVMVDTAELHAMMWVFAGVAAVHLLFYKQFLFVSFDPETAATQGFRPRAWELLFYLVLGVTITVAIQYAGLLAVFAYLVIPAVTGLLAARRMVGAFTIAVASAVVSTLVGFALSLKWDLPISPPIIAVSAALLGTVWLARHAVREAD